MSKYLFLVVFLLASCSSESVELVVERESPVVQGISLAENVGIETLGGVLTPILKVGCSLPCELSQIFSTAEDNQGQITITLIRGSSKRASEGINLGRFEINGIAPAPRGKPQIKVVFGASNGSIWLAASDVGGQSKIRLTKVE
ncbi:Hsp70 family protein [uncultured Pseudoteredinibacter sp.]|uniref:Hsp70 family protein n=1 Tax=uncultured Pseudoteredinibacter sp. TaxID=1641701 RepID=UPI00260D685F|nr:Hsp70 family protein [uncultured Pseudoteredinibacter sp.]